MPPPLAGAACLGGVRCSGRPRSGDAGVTPGGTAGALLKGDLEDGREVSLLAPLGDDEVDGKSPAAVGCDLVAAPGLWTGAGPAGAGALTWSASLTLLQVVLKMVL